MIKELGFACESSGLLVNIRVQSSKQLDNTGERIR